jgi:hypothetical protein
MRISNSVYSYGLLIAGSVFTTIGIISIIYSTTIVKVDIDGIIKPGSKDILSPNMEIGSTASVDLSGSLFNVSITYPNETSILLTSNSSDFEYDIKADQDGKHIIEIFNSGKEDVLIDGYANTKGNEFAIVGQIMLLITGIVILWMGIRAIKRN